MFCPATKEDCKFDECAWFIIRSDDDVMCGVFMIATRLHMLFDIIHMQLHPPHDEEGSKN